MRSSVDDVFGLMFVLFKGFWLLGWSVGVLILGALTVLLLFYGESARLRGGRLVHVARLGPVKIIGEYDLARVRNVRVENAVGGGAHHTARIRFDYAEESTGLGDAMPRADAERLAGRIKSAAAGAGALIDVIDGPTAAPASETPRPKKPAEPDLPPPSLTSPSGLALIAANLVPLAGVLFFGWDLAGASTPSSCEVSVLPDRLPPRGKRCTIFSTRCVPALALLVVFKTALDFAAHRKEHSAQVASP